MLKKSRKCSFFFENEPVFFNKIANWVDKTSFNFYFIYMIFSHRSIYPVIFIVFIGFQNCGKKAVHVERTGEVSASKALVMKELASFKGFVKWSPWSKLDPAMKTTFTGKDGAIGSIYAWQSESQDVGTGSMEITAITENRIEERLVFTNPWQSVSKVYFDVTDQNNGKVKITWAYDGEMPAYMTWFMDMDKMLGKKYEEGLSSFKVHVESL